MKLFSVKCTNKHKVYNICGIKCKIKNKNFMINSPLCSELKTIWEIYGPTNELMQKFAYIEQSKYLWLYEDNKIWLIYIACLLEKNNKAKALEILKKYYIFHKNKDLNLIISVAIFANEQNFAVKDIDKIVYINNYFKLNSSIKGFIEFCKNKNIAIVGNSPSAVGLAQGKNIDCHDIVIRFNNFKIKGYEKDYGSKVNIWVTTFGDDVECKTDQFNIIIYNVDIYHHFLINNSLENIYTNLKRDIKHFYINYKIRNEISEISEIHYPMSGTTIIYLLYKYLSLKNVDLYGFNFQKASPDNFATHYFSDSTDNDRERRTKTHYLAMEDMFLRKLMEIK